VLHEANKNEAELVDEISKYIRSEFSLVRITQTMLTKSIIDGNQHISRLFKDGEVFDYSKAIDGDICYVESKILSSEGWQQRKTSLYRPKAKPGKPGDPRFWPSRLGSIVEDGDLIYLTALNGNLFIIPLRRDFLSGVDLSATFGPIDKPLDRLNEVVSKIKSLHGKWIKSCSPRNVNPKDVGDTLEAVFDLPINNLGTADYHGVELKTKRKKSKTPDTLFSQVPNPDISPCKTAKEVILSYGYDSRHEKRVGFTDLFVTVSNKPNPQGLYLAVNSSEATVEMRSTGKIGRCSKDHLVAAWDFELLEKRLLEKHPTTAWIIADEREIAGEIHFRYEELEVSQKPLFSQFLFLIERGVVVFDWRGGYHPTNGARVDKGHPFRLKGAKNRELLFGSVTPIDLTG